MTGTLIKANGEVSEVAPEKGKKFSYQQLRSFVGGTIDIEPLREYKGEAKSKGQYVIVVNDNGKLDGLPMNEKASTIWREAWPIEKYPHNNDGLIVGDVLVCRRGMV